MVNNVSNDPVRSTATVLVATACVSHIDPKTIFGRRGTTTSCRCATISPSHHHRARDPLMRKVRITHSGTEDDQPLIGFPFSRPGESRLINRIVWWIRGTARLSEVIVHSF